MGGRGSTSATGTGKTGKTRGRILVEGVMADPGKTDKAKNKELMWLIKTEVGFSSVSGMTNWETESVAAIAEALIDLEDKYGAVAGLSGKRDARPALKATNGKGYHGKVDGYLIGGRYRVDLNLSKSSHENSDHTEAIHKRESDGGFKAKTDGSRKSYLQYTVVHEYGHLLSYSLVNKGKIRHVPSATRATKSLVGNDVFPSDYARTSNDEYFAESFASHYLGGKNKHAAGVGMGKFLSSLGY